MASFLSLCEYFPPKLLDKKKGLALLFKFRSFYVLNFVFRKLVIREPKNWGPIGTLLLRI